VGGEKRQPLRGNRLGVGGRKELGKCDVVWWASWGHEFRGIDEDRVYNSYQGGGGEQYVGEEMKGHAISAKRRGQKAGERTFRCSLVKNTSPHDGGKKEYGSSGGGLAILDSTINL